MKKLLLTLTLILPTLAWANPPNVTGNCLPSEQFQQINADIYDINCSDSKAFDANDPTHYARAIWKYVTSAFSTSQNEGGEITGITFRMPGYGITRELHGIVDHDDVNQRVLKVYAKEKPGYANVDNIAIAAYTQTERSPDPKRPNKHNGIVSTIDPKTVNPENGDAAFLAKQLELPNGTIYKWDAAYRVIPNSANVALDAGGLPIKMGPGDRITVDEKGWHLVLANVKGTYSSEVMLIPRPQ